MTRANFTGTVRDSGAEQARDERMLELSEQGLPPSVIAQRMGVTIHSTRVRIKRAKAARDSIS